MNQQYETKEQLREKIIRVKQYQMRSVLYDKETGRKNGAHEAEERSELRCDRGDQDLVKPNKVKRRFHEIEIFLVLISNCPSL